MTNKGMVKKDPMWYLLSIALLLLMLFVFGIWFTVVSPESTAVYQKGFEAGQANASLSFEERNEVAVNFMLEQIRYFDDPDCKNSEFYCFVSIRPADSLIIKNDSDALYLYRNGTWTASWRSDE